MHAEQLSNFPPMTVAEYLAFADEQEFKHEYSRGHIYAMTGGSVRHNTIIASTITHLTNTLADRDCTVTSSDTRVHIATRDAFRYPDVTVFCGKPAYLKGRTDTITNPSLLVEVMSPSTALTDRNDKLNEYTQIESLQAYVLIAQDTPKVEVYRRHTDDRWLYEYASGLDAEIGLPLDDVDLTLPLAMIYRRITWDDDTDTPSSAR